MSKNQHTRSSVFPFPCQPNVLPSPQHNLSLHLKITALGKKRIYSDFCQNPKLKWVVLDVNWLLLFKSSLWIPYQSGHHPILRFANNNWNWEDCIFCFLHVSLVRVKVDPIIFPIFKKILFQNKGNIWNWSILQFDRCTALLVDKSWKISSECSLEKYLLFPLACWTLFKKVTYYVEHFFIGKNDRQTQMFPK